jgi:hypothetical protein
MSTSRADCPGPRALTAGPPRLLTIDADTDVTGNLSNRTRRPSQTAREEQPASVTNTNTNAVLQAHGLRNANADFSMVFISLAHWAEC